jgi:hypothetical protein
MLCELSLMRFIPASRTLSRYKHKWRFFRSCSGLHWPLVGSRTQSPGGRSLPPRIQTLTENEQWAVPETLHSGGRTGHLSVVIFAWWPVALLDA